MRRRTFVGNSCTLAMALSLGTRLYAQTDALRFGLTPVFLSNDLALLGSLQSYLEQATDRRVELVQRRTYQEITALLLTGQLDAAWICGFPFVQFREQLRLVSVPVWKGRPLYQAYLIGAKGRAATGINDLRGDLHCFSDPDSNSGYLVTRALLSDLKTDPDEFFEKSFFAYGHRNVVRAVATGLAESGSVDGYVWEVLSSVEPDLTRDTEVIWKSDWLGFPPVAASVANAESPGPELISQALLNMKSDALGREILAMLQLDGFAVPDPGEYDSIAALVRKVWDSG